MGLTLDELKSVLKAIHSIHFSVDKKATIAAQKLIIREIKLKETDFIRMRDAQGNPIPNEGE